MGIKKYYATKDNTITNAFKADLSTRGTGSNMGASDILEAFVIHGQTTASVDATPSAANATNAEQSRIVLEFPISNISSDMSEGILPSSSGSIKFYLNMYNAPHGNTVPLSYSLDVYMLSQSWSEGRGLDMDNYTDLGYCNWESASVDLRWQDRASTAQPGGSYLDSPEYPTSSVFFETGLENINHDISEAVYSWLNGTTNSGFLVKFPNSAVSGSETFYTKMFFGRNSEFYNYRPTIEARWDSSRKDNRGSFFISSSAVPAAQNQNILYLYNNVRGQLQNIPGLENNKLEVRVYSGSTGPLGSALEIRNHKQDLATFTEAGLLVENGHTITGIYTASFASSSSFDNMFDVWSTGSAGNKIEFFTGSFEPKPVQTSELLFAEEYVTAITNLESSYLKGQKPKLRVFARNKNWDPNIYTVASQDIVPEIIEDAYYRIYRVIDNLEIVPFGTGSANNQFSRLSYDVSGNYFELDTSYLEPGYAYGIQFAYYLQGTYSEQPQTFKFKIKEEDK